MATSDDAVDGKSASSILEWKFHRMRRVCRSTLSAAAAAADTARGHAEFVAMTLIEMLFQGFSAVDATDPRVRIVPIADCKSLYDSVRELTGPCEDKLTQIDIISVRQSCASDIRWVPTTLQRADVLTKRDPKLRNEFRDFMRFPTVTLREK